MMSIKSLLVEALKFGASGITGALISGSIYYTYLSRYGYGYLILSTHMYHGILPVLIRVVRGHSINVIDTSFYVLTSIIGGSVHFALSKVWVFHQQRQKEK
ncbi:MAG: hypothetical protein ABSF63_01150 [Candidatus Bathyarchaeia archaeon]